ncbi:MAG: dockerin type I domain-containing protein [Planctomycetota bacterium]|nr:dockerin type I domain-containing protein [Planctomycetota bacterium]
MNTKVVRIALLMPALLIALPAVADITIYQQNFDTYNDGTLLTDVPGWYNWTSYGGTSPVITGGKVTDVGVGKTYMALDMTDIFSYGNTQARIEFDLKSAEQLDYRFGPGTVTPGSQSAISNQSMGFEHGSGRLYHSNGGFDYGYQQFTNVTNPMQRHWVFDIAKAGTQYTWSATFDGTPLLDVTHVLGITDARGMNTMRFFTLGQVGYELDNILIKAIIAQTPANIVPTPGSPGALDLGLVAVSSISAPQTVTLNNLGQQSGNVTSVSLTGPFSFAAPVPGPTPYAIAGGGSAAYNIVLDPQTVPTNVPRGTPYTGTATFVTSSVTFTYDLTANVFAHAGDVTGDGQVSLLDYNVIKANFGAAYESGNHWADGDVNGDLQVGLLDFNIVKAHFGHTTGDGAAVTAVPEPATMSLLALAGLAALRRKR